VLPLKTRELHSHHFDSTIRNDLRFRNDDIVIATYAKSGTTWVQQMVAQMMFGGPNLAVADMSPWLGVRVPPKALKLPLVPRLDGFPDRLLSPTYGRGGYRSKYM
jgi:aryl sulfotransferase